MADRSVTARFRADISGYMAGLASMERETKNFGTRVGQTAQQHKKDWDKVGKGMLIAGGAMAAGLGYAVKTAADFDKAMSGVKAVADATGGEMDQLRASALKAGADTAFSASQAAQAESELAKAGVSVNDILHGGLIGSMNLAAAGNIDLADAATISAQAMNIFNLRGRDVGHIADVLTAGANKSAAGVGDLGQALQQGGLVAKQTGFTLEDTVATLSAFADSALIGSDAGTSLKTMLQRLTPQSKEAADKMAELGFSAYDAQGNFVGLPKLAGEMRDSFKDLSPQARNAAMALIFGSDAVRGANILYKQGEGGIRKYIKAVDDQGAAQRMAATQMDNLAGDVEQLKGSLETLFIKQGSQGNEFFRAFTQGATGVVNFFSDLPEPIQKTTFWLTAGSSAALLFMGAAMKAVGAARDMKETMDGLAQSSLMADGRLTGAAKAVGAVGIALGGLAIAGNAAQQMYGRNAAGAREAARSLEIYSKEGRNAQGVTGAMQDSFGDLGDYVRYAFQKGAWGSTKEFFSELGTGFGLFGPTGVDTAQNFFKEVDAGLTQMLQDGKRAQAQKIFTQIAKAAKEQGISMAQLKDKLPGYSAAMDAAAASGKRVAEATRQTHRETVAVQPPMDAFGNKLVDDKGKALDARAAMKQLADSIRGLGNTALDAADAQISFQQAIDDARKAANQNTHTLNLNTQAGRDNRSALNQIARSSHELTAAMVENGASQKKVTDSVRAGRQAFINAAESMGATREQAKRLADQAGFTKKDVDKVTESLQQVAKQHPKPKVDVLTAQARKNVKEIQSAISGVHGKTVRVDAEFKAMLDNVRWVRGTPTLHLGSADGSTVPKDGGAYGDRYPYMLAPGEEVISNRHGQADRHRALLKKINAGHSVGLADGGTAMPIRPGRMGADVQNAYNTMIVAAIQAQKPLVAAAIKQMLASGAISGPHMGGSYRTLEAMVARAVPGAIVTSDYRPGAMTIYGTPSSHGLGKAVDWGGNMRGVWDFLFPMRGRLHELLGPWGMFRDGRPYYDPQLQAMHENHVHASVFDQGGWIKPGWSMVYNGLGDHEAYATGVTAKQFAATPRYASQRVGAQAAAGASVPPVVHVTALVENPWTGEQVRATVRDVAVTVADQRMNQVATAAHGRY